MPRVPMPSPNGTNYERLFIERGTSITGNSLAAYDSATFQGFATNDPLPITRERIRARERRNGATLVGDTALQLRQELKKVPNIKPPFPDDDDQARDEAEPIRLPTAVMELLRAKLSSDDFETITQWLENPGDLSPDDAHPWVPPDAAIAMDRARRGRLATERANSEAAVLKRFPHAARLR